MKNSSDVDDKANFDSIYGALFFGVPSQGMDTAALAAMVGDSPQRYELSLLDQEVGHRLRSRQHDEFCGAFDFKDSKIIQFFETKKTATVKEVSLTLTCVHRLVIELDTEPQDKEVVTHWSQEVTR
jgi:hypothetical protein